MRPENQSLSSKYVQHFWPIYILTETRGLFLDIDQQKHDNVFWILKLCGQE